MTAVFDQISDTNKLTVDGFLQEPLFEALFNTPVPRIILKADCPNFTIIAYNNAYERVTYTEGRDITGKFLWDAFDPQNAGGDGGKILLDALTLASETNLTVYMPPFKYDIPSTDETKMEKSWWQLEIIPVTGENGKVAYLLTTTHNITEQGLRRQATDEKPEREQNLIKELAATNKKLVFANEQLNSANQELIVMNEKLTESRKSLQVLNNTLEKRVASRTQKLSESEKQFRQLADSIIQMIWVTDSEGMHEYYNQRWYDFTGSDFEQTKGEGWNHMFHPDDRERAWQTWNHSLKTGKLYEIEYRLKKSTGEYVWVLGRAAPFHDPEGKIIKWFGTCTDISDLKQLQEQKDDFISIASHELKTPITTLKASLQLLNKVKNNPSAKILPVLVEQAYKSSDKVSALIENLLNVSKLNQGQLYLSKTLFTISKLIDECCSYVRLEGKYTIIKKGDLELKLYADPERISQVLVNLVNNALKYAPDSNEIQIKVEKEDDNAKISVIDKGPGIPHEKLSQLFERYYRVDTRGKESSGLGLGLYISSEIIKKHEGKIGVESELGNGTSFWFTIPLSNY